jgi:hypothetical protein
VKNECFSKYLSSYEKFEEDLLIFTYTRYNAIIAIIKITARITYNNPI